MFSKEVQYAVLQLQPRTLELNPELELELRMITLTMVLEPREIGLALAVVSELIEITLAQVLEPIRDRSGPGTGTN